MSDELVQCFECGALYMRGSTHECGTARQPSPEDDTGTAKLPDFDYPLYSNIYIPTDRELLQEIDAKLNKILELLEGR